MAEQTLDYVLRELRLADGALASAQDADTDGVEGADVHVDGGGGRPRRAAAPVRARPHRHPRRARRGARARGCFARRELRPKPRARRQGDRLLERARARRARGGGRGARAARLRRRGGRRRVPARAALRGEGRLSCAAAAQGRPAAPGFLDDYANVAHGLLELHVATGELRWLEEAHRLARRAIELFADEEHGGFFLAPRGGERLVAEKKDLDDHPIPSGQLDARARPAPARPDLRRRRARAARRRRVPAAPRRDPARAVRVRLGARRRSTSTSRRRASSRCSARPTATSPAPRSRRGSPRPWSPVGPADDVPLLAGKGARRRPPGRLRLRALRLPGTGDRSGSVRPWLSARSSRSAATRCEPGDALDDFLLELTGASRPRVLLIPTASAESEDFVVRFYETYARRAEASHLSLFGIPPRRHPLARPRPGRDLRRRRQHGEHARGLARARRRRFLREAWEAGSSSPGRAPARSAGSRPA